MIRIVSSSNQKAVTALLSATRIRDRATETKAAAIVERVRKGGDRALRRFAEELDGLTGPIEVPRGEWEAAARTVPAPVRRAIREAARNIRRVSKAQVPKGWRVTVAPGVTVEQRVVPLARVGCYVPAGRYPLPSSLLMTAIPARSAGVPEVIVACPRPDATVFAAALDAGVDRLFRVGGAQAVAAMAYGTESVPKVDKIFGPGNSWVTAAKQIVSADARGAALDMPAGPSEVLVIADGTARPEFVAADLLAQAEHSEDAQVVLVTTSRELAVACIAEVERQMAALPRRAITERSIGESRVLLVPDLDTALEVSNRYAPEHLILQVAEPRAWLGRVRHAGSVFLGAWTPETMGDYCSGTNHVLPTYGHARAYSGLGVADFVKRMTVQEVTPAGLADLGRTARTLARLESLEAHAHAVSVRLAAIERESLA